MTDIVTTRWAAAVAIALLMALEAAVAPVGAAAARDRATATTRNVFPVQPVPKASYGREHHTYPATDIFAPCGTRVVVPASGYVHEVSTRDLWERKVDDGATRGGLSVSIIGDDDVRYYGSHLATIASGIRAGARVTAGQRLGTVGRTGSARPTPCHLHFGISPPCGRGDWEVRRGVIETWPYLDAWRAGQARSPAAAVAGWAAAHAHLCPQVPAPVVSIDRACPADLVPDAGLVDVAGVHKRAVDCVVWWGVARGVGRDRYAPAEEVRRDQMATFVVTMLARVGVALPEPTDQGFRDVTGNVHEDAINQLAALGVVRGLAEERYGPRARVSRGQMATFLVLAYERAPSRALPVPAVSFLDVEGLTHDVNIRKAAGAGFVSGRTRFLYLPAEPVERGHMASFVARALNRFVVEGRASLP
jgi:peptidoglycan LD-endopeptidase LytH